jgi:hypothetical protein
LLLNLLSVTAHDCASNNLADCRLIWVVFASGRGGGYIERAVGRCDVCTIRDHAGSEF